MRELSIAQRQLASAFSAPGVQDAFQKFQDHLVYYEDAWGTPVYFPPFIPFVGSAYDEGRVLVYAKAQNLAGNPDVRREYHERGPDAMYRLCTERKDSCPTYVQLEIGPVMSGVLPALAGVYLYALDSLWLESLEEVTARLAITNFYKFSLWEVRKSPVNRFRQKDLNPDEYERVQEYAGLTLEYFARTEVRELSPRGILCLKGYGAQLLDTVDAACRPTTLAVNDPAWILRGARGCLKANGSWGKVAARCNDEALCTLIAGYCDQIREWGWGGYRSKADAIATYLKYYATKWTKERRTI